MQKTGIFAFFISLVLFTFFCEAQEQEDIWLDTMHKNISESVMDSAQWFDNFFANEGAEEDQKARGQVRLRLGWEPRTRDLSDFEAKLKVRVKLPHFKNRVDLILSDDEDIRDDKIRAGRSEQLNRREEFTLALRYKAKPDSGLSHRIGFGRRFQYFVKSRYRDAIAVSESIEMRYDASVYYYNRDKFGSDFGLAFDYDWSQNTLLRFDNRYYYRDKSEDWLWQHNLQGFYQLNDSSALIYGYYLEGLSKPNYRLDEYLVSVKFRKHTRREWLFYDIEPFILWRRDENFSASYGIALRIEGFFGER